MSRADGLLVLNDGTEFEGDLLFGRLAVPEAHDASKQGVATGEVVFNTSLTGYQEIITDPSYAGQIITFTYPHIGNYGVNDEDFESARPFCRGVIVRDLARDQSRVGPMPGCVPLERRPVGQDQQRVIHSSSPPRVENQAT